MKNILEFTAADVRMIICDYVETTHGGDAFVRLEGAPFDSELMARVQLTEGDGDDDTADVRFTEPNYEWQAARAFVDAKSLVLVAVEGIDRDWLATKISEATGKQVRVAGDEIQAKGPRARKWRKVGAFWPGRPGALCGRVVVPAGSASSLPSFITARLLDDYEVVAVD
jgi:hypothetical protein